MARFAVIFIEVLWIAAALGVAEAQAGRPVIIPGRQPVPANVQQPAPANVQQPVPQPANTGQPARPGQPTTAPLKPPSAGVSQPAQPSTPASPPSVAYRDGLLSVQAANSTLSSVLAAIRNKTGIEFEGQENVADRVALSLGPAPAGEVLSAIFTGSRFDFVAIGRPDNPGIVQRVILTPKTQAGAVAAAAAPPQPAPNGQPSDEEETPEETPNAGDPQDTQVQQPAPPPQPTPPQAQQGPKSPEQLLQELQEMRKQQQMQQEGAPAPNPGQVPRKPPL